VQASKIARSVVSRLNLTDALAVSGIVVISMLIRAISASYPLAINGI
jgi:hypothetical protein